jgi:hypothetical protein
MENIEIEKFKLWDKVGSYVQGDITYNKYVT